MRQVGLLQRVGVDEFPPLECAVAELQAQPLRHVPDRGAGPARRALGVRVAHVLGTPGVPGLHMQGGLVGRLVVVGEGRAGGVHAERPVQLLGGQLLPTGPGSSCDGDGGFGQPEVGVRVVGAEGGERLVAEVVQDVRAVVAEVLQEVPGVVGQAAV